MIPQLYEMENFVEIYLRKRKARVDTFDFIVCCFVMGLVGLFISGLFTGRVKVRGSGPVTVVF